MNSILNDIKKLLGIASDITSFDTDLIIDINSVFMILTQLGVGPDTGFSITGPTETWSDFMSDMSKAESVKTYIFLKARLMFDPPQNGSVLEANKQLISELEWRLNVACDPGVSE